MAPRSNNRDRTNRPTTANALQINTSLPPLGTDEESIDPKVERFVSQIRLDELCNPQNNYKPVLPNKSGKNSKVARAANSFFQFKPVVTQYAVEHNIKGHNDQSILSKAQSKLWKMLSEEQKVPFNRLYKEAVEYQKVNHPDYKFRPQRQKSDLKIKTKPMIAKKKGNRKSVYSDTDQIFQVAIATSNVELSGVNSDMITDYRQEDVGRTTTTNDYGQEDVGGTTTTNLSYPVDDGVNPTYVTPLISFSDASDSDLSYDSSSSHGVYWSCSSTELDPFSPVSSDDLFYPDSGAISPALSCCSSSFTDENNGALGTVPMSYGNYVLSYEDYVLWNDIYSNANFYTI